MSNNEDIHAKGYDVFNDTPKSRRLHIGFFGSRNVGKSTLVNAICGQSISIVSDMPGTTTDPVEKAMEIHGIGPCLLIDTAGFDDTGNIGALRVNATLQILDKTDVAIIALQDIDEDAKKWIGFFKEKKIPFLSVLTKTDLMTHEEITYTTKRIANFAGSFPFESSLNNFDREAFIEALIRIVPEAFDQATLLKGLVNKGDRILLVMPQDIQAPKGRLILPQVQTLRELLDRKCISCCCSADNFKDALRTFSPSLIITDSQVFPLIFKDKPNDARITSFSILQAGLKGDIDVFVEGAKAISNLSPNSKVLIAEACTHAPLAEDIGRVKIPRMLEKKFGVKKFSFVSGKDFPLDLTPWEIVIHCGGCMFNSRLMQSRIDRAKSQKVPITNYGIAIATLTGILDKVTLPR